MDKAGNIFPESKAEPNAGTGGTKFASWAQFAADSPVTVGTLLDLSMPLFPDRSFIFILCLFLLFILIFFVCLTTRFIYLFFFPSREFVRRNELPRPIQYLCWSPVGSKLVSV